MHFTVHQQEFSLSNQAAHPDLWGRIIFLAAPLALLVIISLCFHKKAMEAQAAYPIWPMPSACPQNFIYYILVLALGAIGIYACVEDAWSTYEWILYGAADILLALYVFFYQCTSRFTLLLTTAAAAALMIDAQWLFIVTADMADGLTNLVIRNLVGAVGAWAIIYTLLTLGQFLVYTLGVNKTCQTVCFFIAAVALIAGVALWNKLSYCEWEEAIGFIATGVFLILFAAFNTHHNKVEDKEKVPSS
jgi:hypothetical protein